MLEEKRAASKRNSVIALNFDKLPLFYTLEQVERLNVATGMSYHVGIVDNIPVAIIGVSNLISGIKGLKLKFDGFQNEYEFKPLEELRATSCEFAVFPFGMELEQDKNLLMCYKDILEEKCISDRNYVSYFNQDFKSQKCQESYSINFDSGIRVGYCLTKHK